MAGRPAVPVIAEVHGNWRHSTRLYGSRARRTLSPLVDALDVYAVRHANAVRVPLNQSCWLGISTTGQT